MNCKDTGCQHSGQRHWTWHPIETKSKGHLSYLSHLLCVSVFQIWIFIHALVLQKQVTASGDLFQFLVSCMVGVQEKIIHVVQNKIKSTSLCSLHVPPPSCNPATQSEQSYAASC